MTQEDINPLNRRKPENRWKRILRDADNDQESIVRHWLKLARKVFEHDQDEDPPISKDHAA